MRFICPWSSTRSTLVVKWIFGVFSLSLSVSLGCYRITSQGVMLIWSFVHTAMSFILVFSSLLSNTIQMYKHKHTHTHCKWNHNKNYYLFAVSLIWLCFIWAGALFASVCFISGANKNEFCQWVRATNARQKKSESNEAKENAQIFIQISYVKWLNPLKYLLAYFLSLRCLPYALNAVHVHMCLVPILPQVTEFVCVRV